jgi:hypothetical protein
MNCIQHVKKFPLVTVKTSQSYITMKSLSFFIYLLFLCLNLQPLFAQDTGVHEPEYIEDIGSGLWEKRSFEDDSDGFNLSDNEYISEEDAVKAIESAVIVEQRNKKINFRDTLKTERELKFDNIKYGTLTGVMIGGWFAMLANISHAGSDSRTNARYIGVGAVLGVILGAAIGSKSLYEDRLRSENLSPVEKPDQNLPSKLWFQDIKTGYSPSGVAWLSYQLLF